MKALKSISKTWMVGFMALALIASASVTFQGCTNLDEETFGVITPDQFFRTEAEIIAALAPVYAQLRSGMWAWHNLSQHPADESMVPVRGTDWDDGGQWRQLIQQTWTPNHPDVNSAWVDAFTGVARANVVLANLANADVPNKVGIEAELRFLRAFYYWQLLDFFGGVPVVTDAATDPDNPPGRNSSAEVFQFIESELNAIRGDLQAANAGNGLIAGGANFGRATQGAVDALLAKIYLNAEVYTGSARWGDAIAASDRILNSGTYSLAGDYFDNFRVSNHTSPEIIFSVGHLPKGGLGFNFIMRTLHYNLIPQTPWNGFMTIAEVFHSFDDTDQRKNMFLVGQMYKQPNQGCIGNECFSDPNSGEVQDRVGNPLIFTPGVFAPDGTPVTGTPVGVDETSGVRVLKWEIDATRSGGDNGNEYAFFRLGEIYLTKAEALNQQGDLSGAVDLVNTIRQRAFSAEDYVALNAGDFNQQSFRERIVLERRFELMWEATRRSDQIRLGTFTDAWEFKPVTESFRVLFPVPQVQLDANPNLTQNPGY